MLQTVVEVEIIPDVVYGHKDGLALTFDVLRPRERANGAGVLSIESGGWYSGWTPPEYRVGGVRTLLDKGFTVFIVRHGSGSKYLLPEVVDDLRRGVRFIRANAANYGVDPERLGVYGCSSGGHLSLMLATTADDGDSENKDPILRVSDRIQAVVAYCPSTDVRSWFQTDKWKEYQAFRFDPKLAGDYSPLLAVSPATAPTFLVHGDQDPTVSIEHSQKMLAEMQKNHVVCELMVIKGGDHGISGDGNADLARALWFEKHLVPTRK